MKIQHIGHAGFIVETGGSRILIDPFFNPAYQGTSRPNPDNSPLMIETADQQYTFLYVSHGHPDHYDHRFLDLMVNLYGKAPFAVLCAPWMADELHAVTGRGTTSKAVEDGGALTLEVIADDWREDSMLLIDDGETRFLHANDTNLDQCEWPKNVDILACQYSGASYYPCMFDYPPEKMAAKIAEAREQQLEMLIRKVRACGAKKLIPCGGPMWIAGVPIGQGTMFPVWKADVAIDFKHVCPDVEVITDGILFARPDQTITKMMPGHYGGYVDFTMPAWLADKVQAGEIGWEEALLTFQVRVRREPDVFDPLLMYPLRGRAVDPPKGSR